MNLRCILAATATAALLLSSASAENHLVHLVVGQKIEPTSTFEVRFEEAMVSSAKVWTTAEPSPIEEMYHPERFGLTETLRLKSLPLK